MWRLREEKGVRGGGAFSGEKAVHTEVGKQMFGDRCLLGPQGQWDTQRTLVSRPYAAPPRPDLCSL